MRQYRNNIQVLNEKHRNDMSKLNEQMQNNMKELRTSKAQSTIKTNIKKKNHCRKKIDGKRANSKVQKQNTKLYSNDYISKVNNAVYSNNQQLPDLFKEIQDIRYGRAKPKEEVSPNIKFNRIQVIDHRFNAAGAIIGILFLILFSMSIHSNYIFATSDKEKLAIGEFEENTNTLNMMDIISSNISSSTKKEIETREIEIPYETKYIENEQLPKDEQRTLQAGRFGFLDRTTIKTYENNELIGENIISEIKKSNPVEEIIEIGTSEYLRDKQVYIGDTMYTTDEIYFYTEPAEEAEKIGMICQHIDVKLKAEGSGWCYISVDDIEGYVRGDLLTSENLTPGIAELARKQRILLTVNFDMPLNCASGLSREDFVRVLSGNPNDRNKIFEDNAGLFYDIEQRYKINGLFLASIGIHESNWGTSNIANQKKNLFGYGAYDFSAFESATTFESYQYGIEFVAKSLVKYYLNERNSLIYDGEAAAGTYYNGPTVSGVNTRYASDENWANKVYTIMQSLYEKL